jgi:NTP pyrophosphatase (non-canonical NTP hydrolase)
VNLKEEAAVDLNEYQKQAIGTAEYPEVGYNIVYPAMGLAGEAGEVCDKIKKFWRNTNHMSASFLHEQDRNEIVKELGDVLWYISAMAEEIGATLNSVAEINLAKLKDRKERGVIKSAGDNR